jgi:hypothetical protein
MSEYTMFPGGKGFFLTLIVRVPTQDVVAIHSDRIENELMEDISLLLLIFYF